MPKKKYMQQRENRSEMLLPDKDQVICVVKDILGADWIYVFCTDGVERKARIPGKFRRRVWMSPGDIVLCYPWDFQSDKADVIYKYTKDEVRKLIEKGLVTKDLLESVV